MKPAQTLFNTLDLKTPFAGFIDGQGSPFGQSRQRSDDSQVFLKGMRICTKSLLQNVFSMLENPAVRLRSERKDHVVVSDQETTMLKDKLQFQVFESLTIKSAEHRQKNFVLDR